jgi:hypothetical protein
MYNRRSPNDSLSYFFVFFAFLAGARTHCVCLFISFSLLIASHLFFLSPIQTHTLSMTTNDNGVRIYIHIYIYTYTYVGSPFSGRFSFLLPSSASSFFFFSFFFTISQNIYIYIQYRPIKEKNQLYVGNSLHDFSFFRSFFSLSLSCLRYTQIYSCKKKERLTLLQQLLILIIYDRYRVYS